MTTTVRQKTLFLNGVEVDAVETTGNRVKDLAAAKKFLADRGLGGPQEKLAPRTKAPRIRRRFL